MLGLGAFAIAMVLAALSYRFIEQPVRTRRLDAALHGDAGWTRPRRVVLVTGLAFAVAGLGAGGTAAVLRAPAQSQAAVFIAAGQAVLSTPPSGAVPLRLPMAERAPVASPAVSLPSGDQIVAVGDSVMLAAAPQLQARFPGIAIDAAVSRQMRQAPEIVSALDAAGQLRPVVVIGLGTNGPIDPATLHDVRAIIGPERSLVFVNTQAPRGWIPEVNAHLSAFAADYREVVIADWYGAIAPQIDLLARDQVHPGAAGGRIYTGAVESAVQYLAELPPVINYDANPELQRPR